MNRNIVPLLLSACVLTCHAAIPTPENLLPEDTLAVITAPDYLRFKAVFNKSPHGQLWNDPAMKPFRDKFYARWDEEVVKPLERELSVNLDDYAKFLQGQCTLAIVRNGWQGDAKASPAFLLLVDSKEGRGDLKKKLTELRKKWFDTGKNLRAEKIRDTEFTVLQMSPDDLPKPLRSFFPKTLQVQEAGADPKPSKADAVPEILVGQSDSLLIVANSAKTVEKVLARLSGGAAPCLTEQGSYQASHLSFFRDAPVYGWVNAKALVEVLARKSSEPSDSESPNPLDAVKMDKVIEATGLRGLNSVGFSLLDAGDGMLLQLFLGVPESNRQGLFKILAGEAKETAPPPFVPADAVKFQRWRMDGQKAWTTLEKMLGDISPQWVSTMNFILNTANEAAKTKDPDFDVRKNLIGNLGDDIISYEKAPRNGAASAPNAQPSILLLGSPNPDQLTAALKSLLVFMSPQGDSPPERDFLGRKIFSIPLPSVPMPTGESSPPGPPATLHYASTTGYLALSTDVALLEEFLRSAESKAKPLRETSGLADATQRVTGPGCSLLGYQNNLEEMRVAFEAIRRNPASGTNVASLNLGRLPGMAGVSNPERTVQDWMDFSLLPEFEKISKFFHFSVYGGSASANALVLKIFAPTPPGLRTN